MTKLAMAAVAAGAMAGEPAEAAKMVKRDDAVVRHAGRRLGQPTRQRRLRRHPECGGVQRGWHVFLHQYEDKECQRVSGAVHSKWYVWDGAIVNEVGEGKTLKDEIVNMAPKKMVLRSLEDSLTYHRVRSTAKTRACAGTQPQPK